MTDDLPDYSNYSLIKAVDEDGNIVSVLCDASGRMVSVMKGDYDGTLKTLAVDDQGRMQAVLSDPEDVFGNPNYIGAGELAARLGSIKSFEKRGEVVFMDDFEDSTLKWGTLGSGAGAAVARSTESARSGDYSLKMTTGNAEGNYAKIINYCSFPVSTRFGIEVSVAFDANIEYFNLWSWSFNGTYEVKPQLVYYPQTDLLCVVDENNDLVTIASDLKLHENDKLYHTFKLVFNISPFTYVRAFCDQHEYDISEYNYQSAANVAAAYLMLRIELFNHSAGNHYAYIDNAIITQNEP